MSISIQTNVNSLVAQQNMAVNSSFQSQTIQQLTSGYRINSAADDAAGLAVANKYRDNIAELTQGVRNANDGVSQLQIIDGGLTNISQILDRMKTLATESSTTTFTGDRSTLNNEYQSLISELNRQAANVGLNSNGSNNQAVSVYIGGGGAVQANAQVTVDLGGSANAVDSTSLGLSSTSLLGAGTDLGAATLNNGANVFAATGGGSQTFVVNMAGGSSFTATVSTSSNTGISVDNAVAQLNSQLSVHGMSAGVDSTNGHLMVSGGSAFTISAGTVVGSGAASGLALSGASAVNSSMFRIDGGNTTAPNSPFTVIGTGNSESMTFTSGGSSVTATLNSTTGGSAAAAVASLNTQLAPLNISAVLGSTGDIEFQSVTNFSVAKTSTDVANGAAAGVFADSSTTAVNASAEAPAVQGSVSNALSSLTSINNAVSQLGLVQGRVGAGENQLNYAINLAQSQITNFSSAQSQIRDADVASEAANLSKAQVLQQASIAAMAQANSAPQAILALLKT